MQIYETNIYICKTIGPEIKPIVLTDMKETSNFWGLLALGVCIILSVNKFTDTKRVVNVKGLATQEVPADHVIWPLVIQDVDNDLVALYSKMDKNAKEIVKFLKAGGIEDSEISTTAPTVYDRTANRYSNEYIASRYQMQQVVTVSSGNVDKVRELILKQGDLIKKGIALNGNDYEHQIQYDFNGLNELKPQMVEVATRNAREVAQKFADDSGSKLGKIQTASQGQFSIYDRDSNTPWIKNVRVVTTVTYYLK